MPRSSPRAVLADPIFLAGSFVCVAVIVVAGWWFYRSEAKAPVPQGFRTPTHLRCPACGEKVPYDPALLGQLCQTCDAGKIYVIDDHADSDPARRGQSIAFVVIAMVIVEGAIFLGVFRLRHHRRSARKEANRRLVWRCPFCRMRFSYTLAQVGTGYRCSRCKTAFELPGPMEEV